MSSKSCVSEGGGLGDVPLDSWPWVTWKSSLSATLLKDLTCTRNPLSSDFSRCFPSIRAMDSFW